MKITLKIIVAFLGTLFLAIFIPNIIIRLFFHNVIRANMSFNLFFIGMLITATIALLIYAGLMHVMVVKRIKKVSEATRLVARGNEDIHLNEAGRDEISLLIKNFNQMVSELQKNQYLNKEFARNYSHELKTPLSTIRGYAELIEMGELSKQEIIEYAAIIVKESQRLADMSSTILQISLLDSTSITPKEDFFNVGEQIRSVITLMQVNWESKKINFDLHIDDIKIQSNQPLLFHVWQNLISNAIRFSKNGGQIDVSVFEKEGKAEIMIKDYGVGIQPADIPHIFDLFFVSSYLKTTTSNGIGLTLVKKAIERLSGSIEVSSQVDHFTVFRITLPLDVESSFEH